MNEEETFKRFIPLVKMIAIQEARKRHRPRHEWDDLIQEGMIGALEAIRKTDAPCKKFVANAVQWQVSDALRPRKTRPETFSFFEKPCDLFEEPFEEEGFREIENQDAFERLIQRLSSREQFVLRAHFVEDKPYRVIGKKLGLDRLQSTRVAHNAFRKLRKSS